MQWLGEQTTLGPPEGRSDVTTQKCTSCSEHHTIFIAFSY